MSFPVISKALRTFLWPKAFGRDLLIKVNPDLGSRDN